MSILRTYLRYSWSPLCLNSFRRSSNFAHCNFSVVRQVQLSPRSVATSFPRCPPKSECLILKWITAFWKSSSVASSLMRLLVYMSMRRSRPGTGCQLVLKSRSFGSRCLKISRRISVGIVLRFGDAGLWTVSYVRKSCHPSAILSGAYLWFSAPSSMLPSLLFLVPSIDCCVLMGSASGSVFNLFLGGSILVLATWDVQVGVSCLVVFVEGRRKQLVALCLAKALPGTSNFTFLQHPHMIIDIANFLEKIVLLDLRKFISIGLKQ